MTRNAVSGSDFNTSMSYKSYESDSAPFAGSCGVVRHHNFYVYRIALAAALSGFLFGFDTAIINGALVFLRQNFHLSEIQTEVAAGSLLLGCVIGSGCAGISADRFGRKSILLAAAAIFGLSSIATALPHNLCEFVIARVVAGLAIGIASVLAPMYIAEISPPRIRGALISLNQMAIAIGIVAAFWTSWLFSSKGESSWRLMFAGAALPSFALLLALCFVPESPRWLFRNGQTDRGLDVLKRISGAAAETEATEIWNSLEGEAGGIAELFSPHLRYPLFIGIVLAVLSQITGINTVNYYGAILFKDHGGSTSASSAIGINVAIGFAALLCTIISLLIIDKVGRKAMLLLGSAGMSLSLCLLGIALRMSPPPTGSILAAILFYVGLFSLSFGPVTWVYLAELFPTAVRGQAMSLATLALWSACLIVSVTFLSLMRFLTAGGTFWLYAGVCAVAFLFVWKWVPETKGRSLEEIQRMWKH